MNVVLEPSDAGPGDALERYLLEGGATMRWCTRAELELLYGVSHGVVATLDDEPIFWDGFFFPPANNPHILRLEILDAMKRRNEETNRLGALVAGALAVAAFPGGGGIPGMGRRRETPITDEEQAAFYKAVDDAEKAAEARGEEAKAAAQAKRDRRAARRIAQEHRHG